MRCSGLSSFLLLSLLSVFLSVSICEFLLYFITLLPSISSTISVPLQSDPLPSLGSTRVLLIGDPHLLHRSGVWIDRIRREWSMKVWSKSDEFSCKIRENQRECREGEKEEKRKKYSARIIFLIAGSQRFHY
jgi:hypothetical protein